MVGVGRPVTEQKDWNGFKFLHKLLRSLSIRVGGCEEPGFAGWLMRTWQGGVMDLNGFDCILQDRLICLRQWQHRQDLFSSIGERMRWVPRGVS